MQQSEVAKVHQALKDLVGVEDHLKNLLGRGARGGKEWTDTTLHVYVNGRPGVNGNPPTDPDPKKAAILKSALTALKKLVSDAKVVLKDVDKAQKIASDQKTLAKYQTAKEFRDKVLAKQLASLKAYEKTSYAFLQPLMSLIPGKDIYPGMKQVETQAVVGSIQGYLECYNKLRIALNSI